MGGNDGPSSLAIHSTTPARDCDRAHGCLAVCDGGQFLAEAARAQNEFRLIGLDETRQQVFGERRINQRGRVAGRRRRKKTDRSFRN